MLDRERSAISWIDFLWLVFLGGLALLPPLSEIHKQLIILAIVVVQLFEGWLINRQPARGPAYVVAIKILLATLLLDHTGDMGINSNYYPIFFLPVVSAAVYFGPIGTLAWTTVASLAYLSLLIEALQEYELGSSGISILTIRVLFFFIAAELAGYISSEVNRLNALVVRFLDFARPSKLETRPERISEIVDHALESAAASFPNAKVKIERQYAPGLPEIQADRQLCEQVFVNLITNALQAMEEQPGSLNGTPDGTLNGMLRLSIAPEVSNGGPGVCVTVEDSGPGVPPELREQIFNPFFTSKKDGVGLGLSIVAKIVDDHRGTIRLDSDTIKGARFRVFFPQATPS